MTLETYKTYYIVIVPPCVMVKDISGLIKSVTTVIENQKQKK